MFELGDIISNSFDTYLGYSSIAEEDMNNHSRFGDDYFMDTVLVSDIFRQV